MFTSDHVLPSFFDLESCRAEYVYSSVFIAAEQVEANSDHVE